ncbi:hypothetical protein ACIRBX_34010 [Kitasatospora sp. NPDC096147]|uniref:hypothetical protein n=1 Tax=Kitasatospora sp. NPDC096147 TaxID=3364093 RepID=UPI0038088B95
MTWTAEWICGACGDGGDDRFDDGTSVDADHDCDQDDGEPQVGWEGRAECSACGWATEAEFTDGEHVDSSHHCAVGQWHPPPPGRHPAGRHDLGLAAPQLTARHPDRFAPPIPPTWKALAMTDTTRPDSVALLVPLELLPARSRPLPAERDLGRAVLDSPLVRGAVWLRWSGHDGIRTLQQDGGPARGWAEKDVDGHQGWVGLLEGRLVAARDQDGEIRPVLHAESWEAGVTLYPALAQHPAHPDGQSAAEDESDDQEDGLLGETRARIRRKAAGLTLDAIDQDLADAHLDLRVADRYADAGDGQAVTATAAATEEWQRIRPEATREARLRIDAAHRRLAGAVADPLHIPPARAGLHLTAAQNRPTRPVVRRRRAGSSQAHDGAAPDFRPGPHRRVSRSPSRSVVEVEPDVEAAVLHDVLVVSELFADLVVPSQACWTDADEVHLHRAEEQTESEVRSDGVNRGDQ